MKRSLAAGSVALLVGAMVSVVASSGNAAPAGPTGLAAAQAAITAHPSDVRAAAGDAYRVDRTISDTSGTHVRYTRTYQGLRVSGGDFVGAAVDRVMAESLTRVLYPDDSTPAGRGLRFLQEYFLVSCSLADIVGRYRRQNPNWRALT